MSSDKIRATKDGQRPSFDRPSFDRPSFDRPSFDRPSKPAQAGSEPRPVVLDVQNISLSFGGVKALTDISFNVREHEVRAIIGPNGAGKSSMLNCINGVYMPQQGSISTMVVPNSSFTSRMKRLMSCFSSTFMPAIGSSSSSTCGSIASARPRSTRFCRP